MFTPAPHTSSHGDWFPQHPWNAGSTSIDGSFEDGTRVDLVTHRDEAYRAYQQQAWNEWLHGRVLVLSRDAHPVLVVPVESVTDHAIKAAVAAWAAGDAGSAAA
jgi:hypothetical protein